MAEAYSAEYQRLLPAALEERLRGWLSACVGGALCLGSTAGWLSLLTWSVNDPSLTLHRLAPTRNLLGHPGAVLADVLLQTLGFSAVFLLFALLMWGLELASSQAISQFRAKAAVLPLAVLALATGCSALPMAANWPLHSGYGGLLGDLLYNGTAGIVGAVMGGRGAGIAGLVLFSGGLAGFTYCLGLVGRTATSGGSPAPAAGERTRLPQFLRRGRGQHAASVPAVEPHFAAAREAHRAEPQPEPVSRPEEPRLPEAVETAPPDIHEAEVGDEIGGREAEFDLSTDIQSRAIAERFAPGGAVRRKGSIEPVLEAPPAVPLRPSAPPRPAAQPRPVARPRERSEPGYRHPSLQLLQRPTGGRPGTELTRATLRGTSRLLEDALADFNIKGEIKDCRPGPVVTLFEFEPTRGTKSSRVIALADDIARSMSTTGARIAAIPGRSVIGIELPNARREPVLLRELLETEAFQSSEATLPIVLGKSIGGEPVIADLARLPHLLVAGTTGSGKSVGLNAMVLSLLYRRSPEECRLLMIDPKMLELAAYNGIPHLLCPVVTDSHKAVAALDWLVREMEERYKRMARLGVRGIDAFNSRVRKARAGGGALKRTVQTGFDRETGKAVYEVETLPLERMPHIVVVIDEFADLMMLAGREIEGALRRISQMARAAGIHIIMATQRPSVDVVTGTVKANLPARVAYKVASKIDSRTVLGEQGAEQLLGKGDALYSTGSGQVTRVHGAFVSDEEVDAVAAFLREQGAPKYVESITDALELSDVGDEREGEGSAEDELYDRAVAIVVRQGKASATHLQKRLGIGYGSANGLIERMERDGIVSPPDSTGRREVLAPPGDDPGSD
jgi:S-DNA-T family DNA segregation ATPase FtsK/SpoIIIE